MDIVTYALCKKQIADALKGAGALKGDTGLSAYDIAVKNGYTGTEKEWLTSLQGKPGYTPYIGDNGNWFVNGVDTGTPATGTVKITSGSNSSEIVIDEENRTISSVVDGVATVVANYDQTESIDSQDINTLFN